MSDWYNNLRDIIIQRLRHELQLEQFVIVSPGEIVSQDGSTTWTAHGVSYTWVKLRGHDSSRVGAVNMTAATEVGTPVLVARQPQKPHTWQIIGPDPAFIRPGQTSPAGGYSVGIHGSNHQTMLESDPGPDPVYVFQPMLYLLKTVADGATLLVDTFQYDYSKGDISRFFPGKETDLTSSVPGAGLIRKVLLYLDRDLNVLVTVEGTTVVDDTVTPIPLPLPPAGVSATKSAWVTLANGQTAILQATHVDDARDFLNAGNETSIPDPTGPGQVFMSDDSSLPFWATPVIADPEDGGGWLTNEDGDLIVEG